MVQDLTDKDGKVHKGFLGRYSGIAASDDFKSALRAVKASKPGSIVFTGHSLGGAIAMLAALDFKLRCAPALSPVGQSFNVRWDMHIIEA